LSEEGGGLWLPLRSETKRRKKEKMMARAQGFWNGGFDEGECEGFDEGVGVGMWDADAWGESSDRFGRFHVSKPETDIRPI